MLRTNYYNAAILNQAIIFFKLKCKGLLSINPLSDNCQPFTFFQP